jgi:hypothetical protein
MGTHTGSWTKFVWKTVDLHEGSLAPLLLHSWVCLVLGQAAGVWLTSRPPAW